MLEVMAAASLALAVAFASWSVAVAHELAQRAGLSAVAAVAAFLLAVRFLYRLADRPDGKHACIDFENAPPSALLLRLQDVLAEASAADRGAGELLLDDPLPAAEPGSRVVQLFQPGALPTAGELRARIDRHLDSREGSPDPPVDHSGELFEALASLKRSLG
jgi:hypothetical protein